RLVDAHGLGITDDHRVEEVGAEVRHVLRGTGAVILVLVLEADERLVHERKTEARDLDPGPGVRLAAALVKEADGAPARGSPHPDRVLVARTGLRRLLVGGEARRGDLEGDRVAVVARDVVARRAAEEVGEVEDAADVDVEAVITRTGEHAAFAAV